MGFGEGARKRGGEFFSGTMSGAVMGAAGDDSRSALVDGGVVQSQGQESVARASVLRRQPVERIFAGAPKFWKITNRARLGNVKVWSGAFDGERYPEGATDDKSTWLQPGETMIVPLEAGLHFVGNVFDPRKPEALDVIERCGGFELETEASAPGKNVPVRKIGGPIGLPDFIIEPMDGRNRRVGEPVSVYETYVDSAMRRTFVRRRGHDPAVVAAEADLLRDRIREYTDEEDDKPLYGANDEIVSTATSRAEDADDAPDMRTITPDDEEDEPELATSGRRSRSRA